MERRRTVRMPKGLADRLARLARRLGMKRSHVARMAIERSLEVMAPAARLRPYEQIKDLIGTLDSGVTDIGSRHREYLVARFRGRGRK